MKYIIMCGGTYAAWEMPRQLQSVNGERIIDRTIRLLRENGVLDIAITSHDDAFIGLGVDILRHKNNYGKGGEWTEAFYPTDEPACYIFGDVYFSPEAIKTIVETETDSIQLFASAPPFAPNYSHQWAEPFAFKVVDQDFFRRAIKYAESMHRIGILKRLISWELWQVIKGTPLNVIDYTNYVAINDYTCDIDYPEDIAKIKGALNE